MHFRSMHMFVEHVLRMCCTCVYADLCSARVYCDLHAVHITHSAAHAALSLLASTCSEQRQAGTCGQPMCNPCANLQEWRCHASLAITASDCIRLQLTVTLCNYCREQQEGAGCPVWPLPAVYCPGLGCDGSNAWHPNHQCHHAGRHRRC